MNKLKFDSIDINMKDNKTGTLHAIRIFKKQMDKGLQLELEELFNKEVELK